MRIKAMSLTILLSALAATACTEKIIGKNYVTWSLGLASSVEFEETDETREYFSQLQASLMESLGDQMRRDSTRDLDKIIWVAFTIDDIGQISNVEVVRNDGGGFAAMLATDAVRRARKPPKMSSSVAESLGTPISLQAKIEFNRPLEEG